MNENRKNRFITPATAWSIIDETTGEKKPLDQYAQERRDARSQLKAEIMELGYDAKTAEHFAGLVEENPVFDSSGNVLIVEGGNILAKLKLNFYVKKKRFGSDTANS